MAWDPHNYKEYLTESTVAKLTVEASQFLSVRGCSLHRADGTSVHVPVTLVPAPLPKESFERATTYTKDTVKLYERVSQNLTFLNEHLKSVAEADPFIGRLVKIMNETSEAAAKQSLHLSISRSDYMLDVREEEKDIRPLQIEFNTVSVALYTLSKHVYAWHKFSALRHGHLSEAAYQLPEHSPSNKLASALAEAHRRYPGAQCCVVFVVQATESNLSDQRTVEYDLFERFRVPCLRLTLAQIAERGRHVKDEQGRDRLYIDGQEVAVVYFRAGYTPKDYPSDKEWDALRLVESSFAIKCPSLPYHLSGAKKIQQVLARPGMVERFVDEETAQRVRKSFAGLWSLDPSDLASEDGAKQAVQRAIQHPDDFVLKPCREGGGNNLWADELVQVLRDGKPEEKAAYVLMERIRPRPTPSAWVREGKSATGHCISELGIYSFYLGDGQTEYLNEAVDYVLRTKPVSTQEGGLVAGFAALDCPLLV